MTFPSVPAPPTWTPFALFPDRSPGPRGRAADDVRGRRLVRSTPLPAFGSAAVPAAFSPTRLAATTLAPDPSILTPSPAFPPMTLPAGRDGLNALYAANVSPPPPPVTNVSTNAPVVPLNRRTLWFGSLLTYRLPSGPNVRPCG